MSLNPLLVFILLSAGLRAEAPWRWMNLADWHAAEKHTQVWSTGSSGWATKGYSSLQEYQDAMRDADLATIGRVKQDYGGEVMVVPGDTNNGHWDTASFRSSLRTAYPGLTNAEVVRQAAHLCFGGMRNAFTEAGYPLMVVAVGDHEIGDNPWPVGNSVTPMVPHFRAGHADVFNETPVVDPGDPTNPRLWTYEANAGTSNRLFTDPIGAVPSRPIGTPYEETSFAWQYKNVLFITVDLFRQDNFTTQLGEEGTVVGDCEGAHLQWFQNVLAAAAGESSIKHIVVLTHLPAIYPVRKYASSGMMVDNTINSAFFAAMRNGGVDLYLAGEVHSNTVTIDPDPGSDLVQWVARGNGATNFSSVDVEDDRLTITTWKNGGSAPDDILLGSLSIDKSGPGDAVITSSGLLTAINPTGLILHYPFEQQVAEDSILTGAAGRTVDATACDLAFENLGEFSNEYTAWTTSTAVGPGRIGNAVQLTAGPSVLGLTSIGPMSHSHPRTIGMWVQTTSSNRQILLNSTTFWGDRQFFNLSLDNGKFEVVLGSGKSRVANSPVLNDGAWHHVAATVPALGSTLNAVNLYIDGILQTDLTTSGGGTAVNTAQANWMGLGILLADSTFKLDTQLGMTDFAGSLDDLGLWTRALGDVETRALFEGAGARGYDASDMEKLFALQAAQVGTADAGSDTWSWNAGASGSPGQFETSGDTVTLDLGGPGALVATIGPDTAPPSPDPAEFATPPAATGPTSGIMVARSGTDFNGPVEYLFIETTGNYGGSSSSWQTSPAFDATGLLPETAYAWTITMRDALGNTTAPSAPFGLITPAHPLDQPLLIGWHSPDGTAENTEANDASPDVVVDGVSGRLQGGRDSWNAFNSTDGTFGSALDFSGGSTHAVRVRTTSGNEHLDLTITNNTGLPLPLSRLHFDFGGHDAGPLTCAVSYLSGDLADANGTLLDTVTRPTGSTSVADYSDYDIDLASALSDTLLGNAASATFRLTFSNATSATTASGIDNISLSRGSSTGTFIPLLAAWHTPNTTSEDTEVDDNTPDLAVSGVTARVWGGRDGWASANCTDDTFGTAPVFAPGFGGSAIRVRSNDNDKDLRVRINNDSGEDLALDALRFDFDGLNNGPLTCEVIFESGGLDDPDGTAIATIVRPVGINSLTGDYLDYDVPLGGALGDTTLADGQSATFLLRFSNAVNNNTASCIDNLAITGVPVQDLSPNLDTDGDRIPDGVEDANGLDAGDSTDAFLDKDGDGSDNYTEYVLGTNLMDSSDYPIIEVNLLASGDVSVVLPAGSEGRLYVLEHNPDLSGPWRAIDAIAGPITGPASFLLPLAGPADFFRIRGIVTP